jgi:putative SOS response-associated peptidase YedK
MCGRYTQIKSWSDLCEYFGISGPAPYGHRPNYNVAPTHMVPIVRILRVNPETRQRELVEARWGLVPSWADDTKIGNNLINARAETAATKPAFRSALKRRRCLIPADGFYEWRAEGKKKQPLYIRRKDGQPMAFAGLWESWEREAEIVESCTILTTEANALMSEFHHRMPVILDPKDFDVWLDPSLEDAADVAYLLKPSPSEDLEYYPVDLMVNSPRNNSPQCIEKLNRVP